MSKDKAYKALSDAVGMFEDITQCKNDGSNEAELLKNLWDAMIDYEYATGKIDWPSQFHNMRRGKDATDKITE